MKKFFYAALLAAAALATAACDDDNNEGGGAVRLAKPVLSSADVSEEAFTVRWNAVDNADSYSYAVNGGKA